MSNESKKTDDDGADYLPQARELSQAIQRLCAAADSDDAVMSALIGATISFARMSQTPPALLMANILKAFSDEGLKINEVLTSALAFMLAERAATR